MTMMSDENRDLSLKSEICISTYHGDDEDTLLETKQCSRNEIETLLSSHDCQAIVAKQNAMRKRAPSFEADDAKRSAA
eukprot:scaffold2204_cov166-Amphora_coffeaeformis.AAC.11